VNVSGSKRPRRTFLKRRFGGHDDYRMAVARYFGNSMMIIPQNTMTMQSKDPQWFKMSMKGIFEFSRQNVTFFGIFNLCERRSSTSNLFVTTPEAF